MPRRKHTEPAAEEAAAVTKPKAKAVTAVYNPVGNVRVNLTAPSGNEYQIAPREPFKIAAEDVDWFFDEWHWAFRQRLCRAEDYNPTCGYSDPKAGEKDHQPEAAYSDPKEGTNDHQPRMEYHPEPAEETKPPTSAEQEEEQPEPVVALAESGVKE